jgi:hypothetical protein
MKSTIGLVQLSDSSDNSRKVAIVEEPKLILVDNYSSVYDLVNHAIQSGVPFSEYIHNHKSTLKLEYDEVYEAKSGWKLLPPFDHPYNVNNCLLSGTGLTHNSSAENRQKMHEGQKHNDLTDSMKMYLWGLEGGHPANGKIGVQPEWFYKGNGSHLKGHGDFLEVPFYADDGGEEAEIAGIYMNDEKSRTWRIGFAAANEFSDHIMEKKNYLYLAPSKLRNCSVGPELIIDPDFKNIKGKVRIYRNNKILWEKEIFSGEDNMSHSVDNLEYHHFKYENHRLPGQVHIHFFGADAFSFGEGVELQDGDNVEIQWHAMGRPLVNKIKKMNSSGRFQKINVCF